MPGTVIKSPKIMASHPGASVSTEAERAERAMQAAKDAAMNLAIAIIIRHHSNKEAVLNDLRALHVVPPTVENTDLPTKVNAKCNEVFRSWLATIRETERTFPG
jgi:hypothetical protein